jgi:hypothetical protein
MAPAGRLEVFDLLGLRRRPARHRLIVHAGTHKTGTTTIQHVLADNRAFLREHGLVYPDSVVPFGKSRAAHHQFAAALTGADAGAEAQAPAFVRAAREGLAPDATLLLSAESIYRHQRGQSHVDFSLDPATFWDRRRAYLVALAAALVGFDVEILLFLRRRDAFAQSLYREFIAMKYWQGPFPAFLETFAPYFDYERHVALFRAVFTTVRIESYEAAVAEGLVPAFFRIIGFPAPPGAEALWLRRSPDGDDLFGLPAARAAFLARYPASLPS